jgi:hypothetical protein
VGDSYVVMSFSTSGSLVSVHACGSSLEQARAIAAHEKSLGRTAVVVAGFLAS